MEIKQISSGVMASPQVPMTGLSAAPPPISPTQGGAPAQAAASGAPAVSQPAKPAAPPAAQSSAEDVRKAVEAANRALQARSNNELQFYLEPETGLSVVKLIERETNTTIMQFPSEEMLQVARSIDRFNGSIIRKTA